MIDYMPPPPPHAPVHLSKKWRNLKIDSLLTHSVASPRTNCFMKLKSPSAPSRCVLQACRLETDLINTFYIKNRPHDEVNIVTHSEANAEIINQVRSSPHAVSFDAVSIHDLKFMSARCPSLFVPGPVGALQTSASY